MICFNGAFAHSIIEEIGNALRPLSPEQDEKKSAALESFSVTSEQRNDP